MFPMFCDEGLRCEQVSYIPIAAACHLGQDRAGHYQGVLKITPTIIQQHTPVTWLITQDNAKPCPVWHIPLKLKCNMTVVWLIRADCMHLPNLPVSEQTMDDLQDAAGRPETSQLDSTEAEILSALRSHPDAVDHDSKRDTTST